MQNTPLEDEIGDKAAKELLASERAKQAKYTPAPWTMGNENNQCCDVVLGVDHNLTCSLDRQDANTGDFVIQRSEMLANAHLITAAPELLEALQDMCNGWVYIRQTHGDLYGVGWDRAQIKAKAAIAKALGDQLPVEKLKNTLLEIINTKGIA